MKNKFSGIIKFIKATIGIVGFFASISTIVSTIILVIGLNKVIKIETQVKETTNSIKSIKDKNKETLFIPQKVDNISKTTREDTSNLKNFKKDYYKRIEEFKDDYNKRLEE